MAVTVHPLDAAHTWTLPAGRPIVLRQTAEVMGIINVTPDSFSDGGSHADAPSAIPAALAMLDLGAAFVDIGGESTRPGSGPVPVELELARVLPVVAGLIAARPGARISIDTSKAEVARQALAAGACMINDVTAGLDPDLFGVVADAGCPLVLMHMQGTPRTMQQAPHYGNLIGEIEAFFCERMKAAESSGVHRSMLILDPGIGFGKTVAHNLQLLRSLPGLARSLGRPLLVGISRKSFISTLAGLTATASLAARDGASHVLHGMLSRSCSLLRVHDVPGALSACRLAAAMAGEWEAHV